MYGLAEGRRIVDNVQKGLVFVVSTHVAFLGFILISTIFVAERQVLLPLQILWMEFFIDLSTSIAFEREPAEPELMTRPPRHAEQPLLTNGILGGIVGAGGFTAVAALVVMLTHGGGFDHAAWLAYTALVVSQCVRAYWNRSVREPIHRLGRNGFLLGACLAGGRRSRPLIPYVPPLAEAFRATPLDLARLAARGASSRSCPRSPPSSPGCAAGAAPSGSPDPETTPGRVSTRLAASAGSR